MKTINYLFSLLSLLLATTLLQAQPCETFTGATNTAPWQAFGSTVFINSPGPSGDTNDQFIQTFDRYGVTYLENEVDYTGDWITNFSGGSICWDINFIADLDNTLNGFNPKIWIYSESPAGNVIREASFEANFEITTSSGWTQVCAPIDVCSNGNLPSNLQGSWTLENGAPTNFSDCENWLILLSNVTGIKLDVEGIYGDPGQTIGLDNICLKEPTTVYGDCDNDINVNDFDNWIAQNVTATLDVPGVDGPNDQYIHADDIGFGLSFIHNQVDFSGDYHTGLAGQEICWDYLLIDDGDNNMVDTETPSLIIYQGDPINPTARARFTSSVTVDENTGWVRVCAPMFSCTEGLPSGPDGSWSMEIGGTGCDDWNNLLMNVTGLGIITEVSEVSDQEEVGIDNVCLQAIPAFGECDEPQGANSFGNWETFNAFISVWDTAPDGPTGPGDSFLSTLDGFEHSYVYNETDFAGNWINNHLGEAFCFDFFSHNPDEVEFSFTIYQGNVLNPIRSATFTFNDEYDSFDGWNNFCAPIALCNNGQMPFNNIGSWNVDNGGSCQDWETLLSNVSGVRLNVETVSGNVSELFGFDNFCFGCDSDQYIDVVGTPFGDRRYEFVTTGFISNNPPLTYTWDFGDGTPTVQTTDPDVEHQYQAEGTYIVCVTVEDAEGCSASRCYQQEVICCDDIDATFTYETIKGGRECYLQITSDTDGDWTLNGDPINPLPTIAVPDGVYQICRELEEETPAGLCRSLYCVVVKITDCEVEELSNNECPTPPPPCSPDCEASFTISNDGACLYEFTNTSSVPNSSQASYLWTFGDGSTSTMESPTHVYSSLTSYTVCLEISTPDGCLDEVCQQVSISELCDEDIFVAYTNCSSMQSDEACSFCFTAYGFTGTPGDQIAYYEWTYPGGTYIGQTLAFGGSGLVGDFDVCVTAVTNYGYQYSYCQTWNCHGVPAQSGNENTLRTNIPNTTATAEKGFEVFPNPATDYLTVTWDNELLAENSDLQIFNSSGQIVKTFRVDHQDTEYRVNVSDLSSGLYMLSMTQKDGSILTKRLIIE